MPLGGKKAKKGSLGTSFIIEKIPATKKLSCSSCINYCSDGSCSIKPIVFSEVGYDIYKNCKEFETSNNTSKKLKNKGKSIKAIKMNEQKLLNKISSILAEDFNYKTVSDNLGISRLEALKLYEKTYQIYSAGNLTRSKVIHMCNAGLDSRDISMFFNIDENKIKRVIEENKSKIKKVKSKKIIKVDPKKEIAEKVNCMIKSGKDFNYISSKLNMSKYEVIKIYNKYYTTYSSLDKDSINKLKNLGLSYKDIGKIYNISKNDVKERIGTSIIASNKINNKNIKNNFRVSNVSIGSQSKYSIESEVQQKTDRYLESINKFGSNPSTKIEEADINRLDKKIEFLNKYNPTNTVELKKCYEIMDKNSRILKKRK